VVGETNARPHYGVVGADATIVLMSRRARLALA